MKPQSPKQAHYWDTILDPQNLSSSQEANFDLALEKSFYNTPAQQFAYQQMGDLNGKHVLEIGCGMGVNSFLLADKEAIVTAIDISQKRTAWVKNLSDKYVRNDIHLALASGEDLPFPDNHFDVVYSNAVFIHLDKVKAAQEAYRVLKSGGIAIFVEPMKYHPLVNLYRYTFGPKIWRTIAFYFSRKDLIELGQVFEWSQHKEFYLTSFISFYWEFGNRDLKKFKKSLKRWNRVDEVLVKLFPFLQRLSWFTVFCGFKK